MNNYYYYTVLLCFMKKSKSVWHAVCFKFISNEGTCRWAPLHHWTSPKLNLLYNTCMITKVVLLCTLVLELEVILVYCFWVSSHFMRGQELSVRITPIPSSLRELKAGQYRIHWDLTNHCFTQSLSLKHMQQLTTAHAHKN